MYRVRQLLDAQSTANISHVLILLAIIILCISYALYVFHRLNHPVIINEMEGGGKRNKNKTLHNQKIHVSYAGASVSELTKWSPVQCVKLVDALFKFSTDGDKIIPNDKKTKFYKEPFITFYLYEQLGPLHRQFGYSEGLRTYLKLVTTLKDEELGEYISKVVKCASEFKQVLNEISNEKQTTEYLVKKEVITEDNKNKVKFTLIINSEQVDTLIVSDDVYNRVSKCKDNKRVVTDDDVYSMLKIYDSLMKCSRSTMQLATPPKIYEQFKQKYDITLEGFASPLNHYFDRFCSAFPEVDAPFGSIGSFFNITISENIVCNPPFDELTLNTCADKLINALDANKINAILVCPKWEDAYFVKICKSSKYLKETLDVPDNEFVLYETDKQTNISISSSYVFILSSK